MGDLQRHLGRSSLLEQRAALRALNSEMVHEDRFYQTVPRFEDSVRRVTGKTVVLFRSDVSDTLVRGLDDLERLYLSARTEASASKRSVADIEARFGAAIVVVHLQLLAKIDELADLAEAATPVTDVRRLAENLGNCAVRLADIETRCSVATTGDLNEEERDKVRRYKVESFVHVAEAVQLRKEALAAGRRLAEADSPDKAQDEIKQRARERLVSIRERANRLRKEGDVHHSVALDQTLRQVDEMLARHAL